MKRIKVECGLCRKPYYQIRKRKALNELNIVTKEGFSKIVCDKCIQEFDDHFLYSVDVKKVRDFKLREVHQELIKRQLEENFRKQLDQEWLLADPWVTKAEA